MSLSALYTRDGHGARRRRFDEGGCHLDGCAFHPYSAHQHLPRMDYQTQRSVHLFQRKGTLDSTHGPIEGIDQTAAARSRFRERPGEERGSRRGAGRSRAGGGGKDG